MRRLVFSAFLMLTIAAFGFVGCSDDDPAPTGSTPNTGGGDHFNVVFTQFTEIVEESAPPVYTGPVAAPQGEWDSMWTDGSYPLLGKVFGEDEPMSLYWNLDQLDDAIMMLGDITDHLDSAGVTGDTLFAFEGGNGQVDYRQMSTATDIPTEAQDVFGFSSVQLDEVFLIQFVEGSDTGYYHLGYTATDTTQTYLTWFNAEWSSNPGVVESFLYYAFVDLNDSTVDIKGSFFKDYGDQTSARWIYDIVTNDNGNFDYRMSWYSNEVPEGSMVACVLGGGNKDTQFALKYRQFTPADTNVVDSVFLLEQMFNSSYAYLGEITTGYEDYVDEADIMTLDYFPTALITSPWAAAAISKKH